MSRGSWYAMTQTSSTCLTVTAMLRAALDGVPLPMRQQNLTGDVVDFF